MHGDEKLFANASGGTVALGLAVGLMPPATHLQKGDVWIVGWHRLASKMNENDTNSINQLLRSLSSSAKSLLKEFLGSKARPAEVGTSRHFFVRTLEKRVLLIVWRRCWQPPFGHCATTAMGSRA